MRFIQNYLDNRFQKVLLNGQTSEWKPVKAGVPRVQFLDHYFFWFILMIPAVNYQLMLNSSLMILLFLSIVNDANKSFENLSNDLI